MQYPLRRKISILLLFLFVVAVALSPQIRAFVGFPSRVRVLEGEPRDILFDFPFTVYIRADKDDVIKINDKSLDGTGFEIRRGSRLRIQPIKLGEANVELRVFNIIPVKRVAVDVLPEVRVLPGGAAIGVLLTSGGVIVVGHSPLIGADGERRYPARDAGLEVGDVILKVNGEPVEGSEQLEKLIDREARAGGEIALEVKRKGRPFTTGVTPIACRVGGESGGPRVKYRIGIYIRDNAAGVGTLSFYDPKTKIYGALGHTISDANTGHGVDVRDGRIVLAHISGIQQGEKGQPGEKVGTFEGRGDVVGNIERNTRFGIFGRLYGIPVNPYYSEPIPVALAEQVKEGPAELLTVIDDYRIERFRVEIYRVARQRRPGGKGLIIKVVDPELLRRTGGIVQGMSGSPVIQDGRLAGVVTHVFVADPTRGYGTLAEWMVKEAGIGGEVAGEAESIGNLIQLS